MSLLAIGTDAKTVKGEKLANPVLTGVLYLLPADSSGLINTCQFASAGCKATCLNTAGRGAFDSVQAGRMRKTKLYVENREAFLAELSSDISKLAKKAKKAGMRVAVRCNGTSDIYTLDKLMALAHPDVQFYSYTKLPKPWLRVLSNLHITFSLSETNEREAREAIEHGINVAVVFDTPRGQELPKTFWGRPVIDGDISDYRPDDEKASDGLGSIIGLRAKGKARKDCLGFVRKASELVSIGAPLSR